MPFGSRSSRVGCTFPDLGLSTCVQSAQSGLEGVAMLGLDELAPAIEGAEGEAVGRGLAPLKLRTRQGFRTALERAADLGREALEGDPARVATSSLVLEPATRVVPAARG